MPSSTFNRKDDSSSWPLFTTVEAIRPLFPAETSVLVAIGGWGDTQGFSDAAFTAESRKLFAQNIRRMIEDTGADGKTLNLKALSWMIHH